MARYIDADEFIKFIERLYGKKTAEVQKYYDEPINLIIKWSQDTLVYLVEKMRDKRGTEIVKCEDCKHFDQNKYGNFCYSDKGMMEPTEMGFCSYGERKE